MRAGRMVVLACVLAGLAACEAPPREPVTLRIGVYRSQDYLPYFVMQERGIARTHGLTLIETPVGGGAESIAEIAAGRMDVAVSAIVPLLAAREQGVVPEKVLALGANSFVDPDHPAVAVLIADDLQGWNDLEGKQIGVNALSGILPVATDLRLKQEGVAGYSFVEVLAANRGLALRGGNIAAAVMTEPYLTQSLARGDGKLLGWIVGGAPFERMEYSILICGAELRRDAPRTVVAYLRAHFAASRWIDENPQAAREILAKRLQLDPRLAQKIYLARFSRDGRSDRRLLEDTLHTMRRGGLVGKHADAQGLYDETLLPQALKAAR